MTETSTMQSEITDAGGCRRRLSVTVTREEVARKYDETLRRYARSAAVAGFRKGKVPPAIVKRRFAREIDEEVRDHLVRHGLAQALEQHKVSPLHNPVVDGPELALDQPYTFSALFEVRPTLRLGEYKGLPVSLPEPELTEGDIDRAVDSIREKLAKFVPVESRPLARGDVAIVDINGRFEKGEGKDFLHRGVMIEIGAENNLPEFDAALPGMSPGDSKSFPVSYPASFGAEHLAGRKVLYTVVLKEIKIKDLPPADDELPKDLGREGTLADLRDSIRKDMLASRKAAIAKQAQEALLRRLLEANPVEVPDVLVEDRLNQQIEEMIHSMLVRGIDPSKAEIDWKEVRGKELPRARQRVLASLILDEIAAQEGIAVSEQEVEQWVLAEGRARGEKPAESRKRLEDRPTRQALQNQLVREKSLDFLLKNATITD